MKQIILFLLLVSSNCFGQVSINFGEEYCDTIPNRFKKSITELRSEIYNNIPGYSKRGKYEKVAYKFADYSAYSENYLLQSGDIYSNWLQLEVYLNKILQELLPNDLKEKSDYKIYIHKSGEANAFASPAGNIYVNIGLISEVDTEAKLAAVIAHELAHLVERHSFMYFIKDEFGAFGNGAIQRNWSEFRYNKNQELSADSLAFHWMKNSKYKPSELLIMFETIEAQEVRNYKRSHKWNKKIIPHATSEERLSAFKRFTQYDKSDEGKYFVVDETYFNEVRQQAKYETLKILLKDLSFYSCLEQSFRFHLMDPNNPTYVYYIMESIRELGFVLPKIWNENFLTYGHYDTVRVNNRIKKIPVKKSLFKEMDLSYVPLYEYEEDKIEAKFYWEEEPKFVTYNEAIEFYNKLGKALKCNECLLSYGKSLENAELKQKYLNGYLQSLAVSGNMDKCLLQKSIKDSTLTKKVILIEKFDVFVKQGQEYIYLSKDSTNAIRRIVDQIRAEYPNKEVYLMDDIKSKSLKDYNDIMDVLYLSVKNIFNPKAKKVFKLFDANEIEYVQCEFYESKNLNNSLEKYKEIVNMDYDEMFSKKESTRKFNVFIQGVSLKNSNQIHYSSYSGVDNKIKFKESGYDRIMPKIVGSFKTKIYR